ncbi:hypothetical protein XELAEV_18006125mg [Xenopus laevis]|uniref:Uncharacterized protein n=1 Tax=Xenopus laevis TaxID=8355 RepID=A0A974I428_XENLA|nr:hypothetical protein XELAEV_18006125mg [Xenopus laevis]
MQKWSVAVVICGFNKRIASLTANAVCFHTNAWYPMSNVCFHNITTYYKTLLSWKQQLEHHIEYSFVSRISLLQHILQLPDPICTAANHLLKRDMSIL